MRTTLLLVACSLFCGGHLRAQPVPGDFSGERTILRSAAPFPWPLSADSTDEVSLVRKEDVLALLNEIYPDKDARAIHVPEVPQVTRVDNFRFVALVKDKPYLLVWHDLDGSRDDGETAVYCEGNSCFHDNLVDDVGNGDLVDVDGDGDVELIARYCVELCLGMERYLKPIYTYSIYKFVENRGFTDYSAKAVDYYTKNLLPHIEEARKEAEDPSFATTVGGKPPVGRSPEQQAKARIAVQYVYDDYLRRVLGQKSAGLEDAIRWVDSSDSNIRGLGFRSQERIPASGAEAKLLELAKSKDKSLADGARQILRSLAKYLSEGLLN